MRPRRPRSLIARLVQAALLALAGLALLPVVAEAHSYVLRSEPSAGVSGPHVPGAVRITFSEPPDPGLSTIQVVDAHGKSVTAGSAQPVAGAPTDLTVALGRNLPNGAYTVNWHVVSALDGHATQGSFAFGVGASADLLGAATSSAPVPAVPLSPLGVAGRWVFYVGLGLLAGGAWLALFALRGSTRLPALTAVGSVVMLAGLLAYGAAEAQAVGATPAGLPGTSLGRGLLAEAVPAVAAVALAQGLLWTR
jgi:methionine-rich copper-binding protein CopC